MPDLSNDDSLELACLCARIADEFRGQDTVVLDLRGVSPLTDFFVITTATSSRQMHALVEEVHRALKAHGASRMGVEGGDSSSWVLGDYGDIVLHVFHPEARATYDLERLWPPSVAPRVAWQTAVPA